MEVGFSLVDEKIAGSQFFGGYSRQAETVSSYEKLKCNNQVWISITS